MCILFVSLNASPAPDGYRLILASNRDETYTRPSKSSHFWEENNMVIGGRDNEPGKEGGTWLGMNKCGRIGALLNFLRPVGFEDASAKGRGPLVSNFLLGNQSGSQYLKELSKEGDMYSSFNMVTLDFSSRPEDCNIGFYTNTTDSPPVTLPPGTYAFGNCPLDLPWRKVGYGRDRFSKAVQLFPSTSIKPQLVEELFSILTDDTPHIPDPQLELQGQGKQPDMIRSLSSIFVKVPLHKYGSRTNTLILVDSSGNVDYIERTMVEPVNPNNPEWSVNTYTFNMDNTGAGESSTLA